MNGKRVGASPEGETPDVQAGAGLEPKPACTINCNALLEVCKPVKQTLSGKWNPQTKANLQAYLDLGLVPIPLRGKIPKVKWCHGWNPTSLDDLKSYSSCSNWGIKTGEGLAVVDFDTNTAFTDFLKENLERLPDGLPLVKTGRGYHLWFSPTEPLRNRRFDGGDVKAEGGQVVAPPSIHPTTHKPYRFLWQLGESIPSLDLRQLKLPAQKKEDSGTESANEVKDRGKGSAKGRGSNSNIGCVERTRFDFSLIKDGVGEGQRHSSLVSYIGHLIWRNLSEAEILVLVTDWNSKCKPPLSKDEVATTVHYCFDRYSKENTSDNKIVPTKTLNQFTSVLNETQNSHRINHDQRHSTREAPRPVAEPDPANAWDTEPASDQPRNCGQKRSILRRGREYLSVSFFCGRWSCEKCGPFFKQRWIEHLTTVTEGVDLYVTEIHESDWARIRRAINRLGADYVKITAGCSCKIVTSKPLDGSQPLNHEALQSYLESAIPITADRNPISTSRGWEHHKEEKVQSDYESVTMTWLPLAEQLDVAQKLGAKKVKYNRWLSPQDIDEAEWAEKFTQRLRRRERLVEWWTEHSDHGADMQDYLNQQYAQDAANDACAKDDPFDNCLFEE